ncbi:DUF484 family protein [Roseivivax sp. CAU 1761]
MSNPAIDETLRETLLAAPDLLLDDADLMRALVGANERSMGGNIVDLRGIAMERLERRLDRLEETHRSVIAAAYENLAGTNQIHRAVLRLLDPLEFEGFLRELRGEVADILRVDCVRLILESHEGGEVPAFRRLGGVLALAEPGFVDDYLGAIRGGRPRPVTLQQVGAGDPRVYGEEGRRVRSEACLRLDLGEGRLPGLLMLGATSPEQFTPQHGTDLLGFFGGVFERAMRRWLE